MKNINANTALLICMLLTIGCQQKSDNHGHDHSHDSGGMGENQELYDQVMGVHDEVMPKMNDLHKAKMSLQTRLQLPGLPEDERKQINIQINRIDSASEGMMVWMRQFQPPADTVGKDEARRYLENELEKVREVRQDILNALETSTSG